MAIPDDCPAPTIDHSLADSLYLSRYDESWEKQLKECTLLSPVCCIADLILFMVNESQRLMDDIDHSDDWYFHHDALDFMTNKESKK